MVSANSKLSRLISQLQSFTIPKDDGDGSSPEKCSESMVPSSPVVVDLTTLGDDEIEGCDTPGPAEIRRQRLAEFFKRRKAEKATGVKNPKNVPESSPKAPSSTVGGLEIAKKNDYVLPEYVP